MTQLFKMEVFDTNFRSDGLYVHLDAGEPVTVNGSPMVRLRHGTIVPAAGWHADKQDARLKAADRIEAIGRTLLEQAGRLRREADRGE